MKLYNLPTTCRQSAVITFLALLLTCSSFNGTAQSCLTVPAGLVSWWAGDNSTEDEQGANHGTVQNSAAFTDGKVDQAFSFGGGSHIRVPDAPSLRLTSGLTLEAWIYP